MSPDGLINQYLNNLLTLLKIERAEDLRQYQLKIANRGVQEKKKEGVCWYPVTIADQRTTVGEKIELSLDRTGDFDQRHFFQSGASVSMFSNQSDQDYRLSAVISYMKKDSMRIVVNNTELPDWFHQGKLGVDLLFDESSYIEMESCLKTLLKIDKGRTGEFKKLFIGDGIPDFKSTFDLSLPSLNQSQNEALKHVLSAKDLGIIHGPPGTGKTTTIVKCIKTIVAEEKQVLVCAPSNVAVDILVEKLVSEGVTTLRLGHPARVTSHVLKNTLDSKIESHVDYKMLKSLRKQAEELWKMGAKYKRNFGPSERAQRKHIYDEAKRLKSEARDLERHMIQQLIDETGVIACTLSGANHRLIKDRYFKTVFIDEAGQAIEPACWIPMMKAARVIMAGDHQQLPPTVKSVEAARGGLEKTLFERMIEVKGIGVLLKEQYRMQPEIMAYSSQYFYNNALIAANEIHERLSFFEGTEVSFIDTAGCGFHEKINEQTLSTYNNEEARLLLKDLSGVLINLKEPLEIGIIAPYKAQVNVLREELSNFDFGNYTESDISIHSVDGFQGQEKDVIYISMVRSNDKGEIGFLKNIKRMNVAMTRAKYKLVIVGDSATLCTFPFYDGLVSFFQKKNWYRSAFEIIYSD